MPHEPVRIVPMLQGDQAEHIARSLGYAALSEALDDQVITRFLGKYGQTVGYRLFEPHRFPDCYSPRAKLVRQDTALFEGLRVAGERLRAPV